MLTSKVRGTKRTCQNPECGSRFYDLGRDPVFCPICGFEYRLAPEMLEEEISDDVERAESLTILASSTAINNDPDGSDGDEVSDDDARTCLWCTGRCGWRGYRCW